MNPQQGSAYPLPPGQYAAPYRYDEPIDPQIPRGYPDHLDQGPLPVQQTPQRPQGQSRTLSTSSEAKQRLRKACDSCSVRKVKCDESGPPCKSCLALEIPCTFERPSRRRGPPNRHAEAIKRQRLENGSHPTSTGSPTHDAAYSLASLSLPSTLSAESICDLGTLEILLDDYFLYIHPLVPLPHEPTFRAAFARREDKTDRTFLALVATMLETLVASFPRRARRVFTSEQARHQFPNAGAVIERCHQVFVEARGAGYLDKTITMNDALASYLAGLASVYNYNIKVMRLYFGECVMMLRVLGYHHHAGRASIDETEQPQRKMPVNYIHQESGRRLFWLMFVSAMSGRQLDDPEADLMMPPTAFVELLPPLPLEVDDQYITEHRVFPQPAEVVSEMVGFNLNCKIFRAFHTLAALETAFGSDRVYDWDRQRQVLRRALQSVKAATADAPKELQLNSVNDFGEWPPPSYDSSAYSIQDSAFGQTRQYPSSRRGSIVSPLSKHAVQYEIQKTNIYGSQLGTRSYLVERYWNLYDIHDRQKSGGVWQGDRMSSISSTSSPPTVPDHQFISAFAKTPSDSQMDTSEQSMSVEREDIVRDMAVLLKSINQVNMEPNGLSFCNKIRQVASTLLDTRHGGVTTMPTLDSESVTHYLIGFLEILQKLQRLGPQKIRSDDYDEFGAGRSMEEIEEEELVHWASLKEHQEKFVRSEEILVA